MADDKTTPSPGPSGETAAGADAPAEIHNPGQVKPGAVEDIGIGGQGGDNPPSPDATAEAASPQGTTRPQGDLIDAGIDQENF